MAQHGRTAGTVDEVIRTAAILARGLGTRMRRDDAGAALDEQQAAVAKTGVKAMMPIGSGDRAGRPFLDYLISGLADAGLREVVLVIGPEHDAIRTYYDHDHPPTRVKVRYAVQQDPLGTANAVIAAATEIGDEPFLVLNADNYYPREALHWLAASNRAATIAFDRDVLVRDGNIAPQRVRAFAVLTLSDDGRLTGIVEKPGDTLDLSSEAARWVGMNCWALTPELVDACRRVPRSVRGEFELPEAVALALSEGTEIHAERMALGVLDLSHRADIAVVARALEHIEPHP